MIVFVAPNPAKQNNAEGYYTRVKAIEELLTGSHKYITDFNNAQELLSSLKKAQSIYVHSVYMLENYFFYLKPFASKVIIDLHGVVPEEEQMIGSHDHSERLGNFEKLAFQAFSNFVVVSHAMTKHYKQKYNLDKSVKFITLPIFNTIKTITDLNSKDEQLVVYSGGLQKWQNLDQMLELVRKAENKNFLFLTHSPELVIDKLEKKFHPRVKAKSVPHEEIFSYYQKPAFGLILRDDNIVNKVACPTKLIEYMQNGVIPIVNSSKIGDFDDLGFAYITKEQLSIKKISKENISKMIDHNLNVINKLEHTTEKGATQLKALIKFTAKDNPITEISNQDYLDLLSEYHSTKTDLQDILNDRERIIAHLQKVEREYSRLKKSITVRYVNRIKGILRIG